MIYKFDRPSFTPLIRRIDLKLETLHDLYVEELKDLYNAVHQILKALPKMIKTATALTRACAIRGSGPAIAQTAKVRKATATTAGTK